MDTLLSRPAFARTPTWRLLLACAQPTPHPETVRRAATDPGVDWDALLPLSERHRVVPFLVNGLTQTHDDPTPPAVRWALSQRFSAIRRQNLVMAGELARIGRDFAQHGIGLAAFKGPMLATLQYGGLARRQFNDLDLLVTGADVPLAAERLKRLGYRPLQEDPTALSARGMVRLLRRDTDQAFTTRRGGSVVIVELHWRLDRPGRHRMSSEAAQIGTFGGTAIPTFPHQELIPYLATHGAYHQWSRLLWLTDFAVSLRHEQAPSWARIAEVARARRADRALALALALAEVLFEDFDLTREETGFLHAYRGARASMPGVFRALAEPEQPVHRPVSWVLGPFLWRIRLEGGPGDALEAALSRLRPSPGESEVLGWPRATLNRLRRVLARVIRPSLLDD